MTLRAVIMVLTVITLTGLADGKKDSTDADANQKEVTGGAGGIKAFVSPGGQIDVYRDKAEGGKTDTATISFGSIKGGGIDVKSYYLQFGSIIMTE